MRVTIKGHFTLTIYVSQYKLHNMLSIAAPSLDAKRTFICTRLSNFAQTAKKAPQNRYKKQAVLRILLNHLSSLTFSSRTSRLHFTLGDIRFRPMQQATARQVKRLTKNRPKTNVSLVNIDYKGTEFNIIMKIETRKLPCFKFVKKIVRSSETVQLKAVIPCFKPTEQSSQEGSPERGTPTSNIVSPRPSDKRSCI